MRSPRACLYSAFVLLPWSSSVPGDLSIGCPLEAALAD